MWNLRITAVNYVITKCNRKMAKFERHSWTSFSVPFAARSSIPDCALTKSENDVQECLQILPLSFFITRLRSGAALSYYHLRSSMKCELFYGFVYVLNPMYFE